MKTKGEENRHIKISRYQRDQIKNSIESIKRYVECVKDTSETIRREVKNSEDDKRRQKMN